MITGELSMFFTEGKVKLHCTWNNGSYLLKVISLKVETCRLYNIDWKQWRQSYKSLALLEFLLTHGPEEFAHEFICDIDVIQELATFKYVDDKGFDWGAAMQKKSERIMQLLRGGEILKEARLKALKITKEIQGFGSLHMSPPTASTPSPSSANSSRSSFGTFSSASSTWSGCDQEEFFDSKTPTKADTPTANGWTYAGQTKQYENPVNRTGLTKMSRQSSGNVDDEGTHIWNSPTFQETGYLLEGNEDEDDQKGQKKDGFLTGIRTKLSGIGPKFGCEGNKTYFRSFSDAGREMKKKFDHQVSMKY
uniref:ENTH domain-containing protein n=1 Tax=Kalanchoe fedtschenkoi TaxID=63787 RepID=A0A7N1A551_KALFE